MYYVVRVNKTLLRFSVDELTECVPIKMLQMSRGVANETDPHPSSLACFACRPFAGFHRWSQRARRKVVIANPETGRLVSVAVCGAPHINDIIIFYFSLTLLAQRGKCDRFWCLRARRNKSIMCAPDNTIEDSSRSFNTSLVTLSSRRGDIKEQLLWGKKLNRTWEGRPPTGYWAYRTQ